jgi:hypothetical protein
MDWQACEWRVLTLQRFVCACRILLPRNGNILTVPLGDWLGDRRLGAPKLHHGVLQHQFVPRFSELLFERTDADLVLRSRPDLDVALLLQLSDLDCLTAALLLESFWLTAIPRNPPGSGHM